MLYLAIEVVMTLAIRDGCVDAAPGRILVALNTSTVSKIEPRARVP